MKTISDEALIGKLVDELEWRGKTSEDEFMIAYNAAAAALSIAGIDLVDDDDFVDNFEYKDYPELYSYFMYIIDSKKEDRG